MSVIFSGETVDGVVVVSDITDAVDSGVVTFFVVRQSEVGEVGAVDAAVVGATWIGVEVSNSGAVVVEVASLEGVVCKTLSVAPTGMCGPVVSELVYGVILSVVKCATGVTESVVFAEVVAVKCTVVVSSGDRDGTGEGVVAIVLGNPGGVTVVVSGEILSTVTGFVLESVDTMVAVLGTVVFSVTTEGSESETGPGLEVVTIKV